jgi:hypothetical protein
LIQSLEGVDVQVLGIGENGHIGFNEPGSVLDGRTSEVQLVSSTIKANSRFFEKEEDVPKKLSPWVLVLFPKRGEFCSLLPKKQSTRRKVHAGRPRNEFLSGFSTAEISESHRGGRQGSTLRNAITNPQNRESPVVPDSSS